MLKILKARQVPVLDTLDVLFPMKIEITKQTRRSRDKRSQKSETVILVLCKSRDI